MANEHQGECQSFSNPEWATRTRHALVQGLVLLRPFQLQIAPCQHLCSVAMCQRMWAIPFLTSLVDKVKMAGFQRLPSPLYLLQCHSNAGLEEIAKQHPGRTAIVVTHGGVLQVLYRCPQPQHLLRHL